MKRIFSRTKMKENQPKFSFKTWTTSKLQIFLLLKNLTQKLIGIAVALSCTMPFSIIFLNACNKIIASGVERRLHHPLPGCRMAHCHFSDGHNENVLYLDERLMFRLFERMKR